MGCRSTKHLNSVSDDQVVVTHVVQKTMNGGEYDVITDLTSLHGPALFPCKMAICCMCLYRF